jgi:hypothetical protein
MYIQWHYSVFRKGNPVTCNDMDKPREYYTKWVILSEVNQVQKPKAICFLLYVEYIPNTNTAILWKTGYVKGEGHTQCGG